jgi:2-polyprenyl-6-methoxyphenol hydroxylase-like FAD-dependent oxidoreductase
MHIVTGEKLGAGAFKSEVLKDFRANRKQLRLTIQGDVNIEFNHRLVSIESRDGSVIASFANGSQIKGHILIAADGIHSFSGFLWPRTCPQSSNAKQYGRR